MLYVFLIINFFQVFPEDLLPKMVCIDCCLKLNQSCEFFETSSHAQTVLQMTVGAQKGAGVEGVGVRNVVGNIFKT
jgi:hypothetical protein